MVNLKDLLQMNIGQAYGRVLENIAEVCKKTGRNADDVKVVAVSKTFPVETIQKAYEAGLRIFGENRAQDFRDKTPLLPQDIEWHFIGHLQKNKIKYVIPRAELVQSVDSLKLAKALSDYALRNDKIQPVLLEVNTSGEKSKFGAAPQEAVDLFQRVDELSGLSLKGLMTIGPFTDDEQAIRKAFRLLVKIKRELEKYLSENKLAVLSMGMTHDYKIAIEEGSNMVRLGTAIFGARGR